MAWTAPRTWVTSEVVTASVMNTHVRDNLLETVPAKATTAGRLFVATGTNAVAERPNTFEQVNTAETTSSTSYTDLATTGPDLTLTTGTRALVFINSLVRNDTLGGDCRVSVDVSGASTVSASDDRSIRYESSAADDLIRLGGSMMFTSLTAGSNTFTMKYKVSTGTGTFNNRELIVVAL